MNLAPGRLRQLAAEAFAANGHIVGHSTLPALAPPGTKAAICRGFANAHGRAILALRIAAGRAELLLTLALRGDWPVCVADWRSFARYAVGMRYADGGGLTAKARQRREAVRLEAAA
ncbi:hypothetical protein AB0R04_38790, partial [Kitasatospora sp. NPDC056731]